MTGDNVLVLGYVITFWTAMAGIHVVRSKMKMERKKEFHSAPVLSDIPPEMLPPIPPVEMFPVARGPMISRHLAEHLELKDFLRY